MIRILIPLDGSPVAEEALIHAMAIAKTFPAELILLRVIAESDTSAAVRMDSIDFALWRHQARTYLDSLVDRYATESLSIRCEVAEGHPAETIIQFMTKTNPDLLVLTRYGRGNAQDFATGGTAQKIVSSADCSVLLLDPRGSTDPEKHYRRILVPIDDSKDSDCAVAIATMIAEIHEASLLLLHVTDEPRLPSGLPPTRHAHQLVNEMQRLVRLEAKRRLRELAAKIPSQVAVDTRVLVSPDTSLAIESTADEYDSDLLLLHTNNVGPEQGRRYDTVSQSLILYSHRPLFILRAPAGEGLASNFRSVYLDERRLEAG
jgi:nucleotide-binding universal stress UspA family protein